MRFVPITVAILLVLGITYLATAYISPLVGLIVAVPVGYALGTLAAYIEESLEVRK